jgi:Zn-dependent protease with chaperone function
VANQTNTSLVEAKVAERKKMEAQFRSRVQRYEELAARNPKGYRLMVRSFGYVGFGYILLILAVLLLLIGGTIWMIIVSNGNSGIWRIAFFAGVVAVAIIRSLIVKMEKPGGLNVTRADAPVLWQEVEKIASGLGAPIPHEIRISTELNASAYQRPRLGIFGFFQNYLTLGMPLLLTLTPDEARSVIAHEFGHFSGQHGRFGAWAYRVNLTWAQLRDNLMRSGGRGAWIFIWFIRWFSPRFSAMTFVLRRAHEYEADRAAAQVAGAPTAASALMRLSYLDQQINEKFWTPFFNQVSTLPQPPGNSFVKMPNALHQPASREEVKKSLVFAFKQPTDYDDTHPSLTDRLKSLGQLPTDLEATVATLSSPPSVDAAHEMFGQGLPNALQKLEALHAEKIKVSWTKEHQRRLAQQQKLQELESISERNEKQDVDLAILIYGTKSPEEGEQALRNGLDKYPNNLSLKFNLGELLLDRGDVLGVQLLEEVMAAEPSSRNEGRQMLASYYYRNGQDERLEILKEQEIVAQTQMAIAEQAAWNPTLRDDFLPPDLDKEQEATIKQLLGQVKDLGVAYVARRVLPGTGEAAYMIVAFPRRKLLERSNEKQLLVQQLAQLQFGLKAKIFSPVQAKLWIKRLDKVPGSKMFDVKQSRKR